MEAINYSGKMIDSDQKYNNKEKNTDKNVEKYKNIDLFSIKNAYQAMIIQKTLETHEIIANILKMSHPLSKMTLAFILLNPFQTYMLIKSNSLHLYSFGSFFIRSLKAFIFRKPQPVKKTFDISYIVDNSINHLYVAFDWYLKSNSKVKKNENHMIVSMIKPIEPSKKDKNYSILKSVPEEKETEFVYDNCTFNYSKTSFDDVIYAPSGEMKKKNYKLSIWSYHCTDEIFDNLSTHVINAYSKSKVEEIWIQKIYNHSNGIWKDTVLERNKRKIASVVMKNNKNKQISDLLNHFIQTEEWHLERGIPYKKSFLFYGPPGTGKTSMIKAMSFELQRHIHYLNLSSITNDNELTNLMSNINYKETILVIEDIDAQGSFVNKRNSTNNNSKNTSDETNDFTNIGQVNNIMDPTGIVALSYLIQNTNKQNNEDEQDKKNKGTKITLSCILNQIDGIRNNHGMILVMTTNYPDLLDEALIRDGRVDERVFFDYCDHEQIYSMFKNFYNSENPLSLDVIKSKINLSKYNIAPCNVENSMRRHYSNQMAALDDIVNSIIDKKNFEKYDIN